MTRGRAIGLALPLAITVLMALWPVLKGNDAAARELIFTVLLAIALASSLNILLGYTGYVSFGHIVFFGLGGYVGFYLLASLGWSLYLAILAGGLASAIAAFLLGKAILHLRGAYFALATIGINQAVRAFVNNFDPLGGPIGLRLNFRVYNDYGGATQALWLAYWITAALTVIVIVVSHLVRSSKFGLGLTAIRENEDAAEVMGVATPSAKTSAYVLSAIVPGMVGVLFFFKNGNILPESAFRLHRSIETLVMVMLGGYGTVLGPVLGATGYERLRGTLLVAERVKDFQLVVAGVLLLIIILFIPAGLVGVASQANPQITESARMMLQVKSVTKRFGGLTAVRAVSLELKEGEILGLIGPNGAGKTTLFNVINGIYKPDEGRVLFKGTDITGLRPYQVARLGIARTHQIVQPLNELTVRQNVMVGACFGREHHHLAQAAGVADEVLAFVGLADRTEQLAGSLNVAQKKRLEMARALAARPFLLLLDEVLAGLNASEIAAMVQTVRAVRERGVTIMMIEHVMHAVMKASERVLVLDYGEMIAEGTPEEVSANPKVIEAYLGDPKVAERMAQRGPSPRTDSDATA